MTRSNTVTITVAGAQALKVALSQPSSGAPITASVTGGTPNGSGSYDVIGPLGDSSTGFFTFGPTGSYSFNVSLFDGAGTYSVSVRDSTTGTTASATISAH